AVRDILHEVQDISFVHFGGEDVVRHKLVQAIVAAYDVADRKSPEGGDEPAADRERGAGGRAEE
ncbi:MAG TPA: PhoH family protein, partial [Solirubrobacterales bacterium]|nr:PhoH family protein [Solirubrobacterales bacterium]